MSAAVRVRHGTKYRYQQGCRCAECREAQRVARKAARDQARAKNSPAYQRELAASRKLKESYRGACERCGAATTGCNGPGLAPPLCSRCSAGEVGLARRGNGPLIDGVRSLIREGKNSRGEIDDVFGHDRASVAIARLLRYGLVERVGRGIYRNKEKAA